MEKVVVMRALLLLLYACVCNGIVLRLRMPTGALKRIDVGEDEAIIDRLKEDGILSSTASLSVEGRIFGDRDTAASLSLKAGDIISVLDDAMKRKKSSSSPDKPKSSSSSSSSRRGASKALNGDAGNKMMSNVDIDKRRRELTKITRQKSTGKRYVSVTTSGSRILKRLSRNL